MYIKLPDKIVVVMTPESKIENFISTSFSLWPEIKNSNTKLCFHVNVICPDSTETLTSLRLFDQIPSLGHLKILHKSPSPLE